jgi:transcriptional regulator with PAS, ATPase and Fis domain
VPLSGDQDHSARSLLRTLDAISEGAAARCALCPLGDLSEEAAVCTAVLADPSGTEWTGHATPTGLCFPFVAGTPSMRELARLGKRVATSDATILISGESGTGKEVLARYIHRHGSRQRAPFVKVNCAALPDQLLESEIFGYEKGAFTGAEAAKPGRFELAEGGIIFLDEISEMDLGLQAKMLQVLEAKSFHRLGALKEKAVDVQIIAATNRDLEQEVAEGRFREDLLFRLRVIELRLPPLRDRRDDIPRLIDYFLCRLSRQHSRPIPAPGPALRDLLQNAPWAGNVRELENALRRLVILGEEGPLVDELRGKELSGPGSGRPGPAERDEPSSRARGGLREVAQRAAQEAEKEAILAALSETRWNRTKAARALGVSYKTLLSKMKKLLSSDPEAP